ncbi:MAG TPA: hypothetical protein DDZ88_26885 [Verrucomicrobiales bacterium]|nr:hypothetical protein [Verrucomicrobiales bacterium]
MYALTVARATGVFLVLGHKVQFTELDSITVCPDATGAALSVAASAMASAIDRIFLVIIIGGFSMR